MRTLTAGALPLAAWLWIAVLLLTPIAASRGALSVATAATYYAGSLICHQQPARSFAIAGVQMPVCGRCFGLYLAGAAGALAAFGFGRRRQAPNAGAARAVLAVTAVPMLLSVGLEVLGIANGSNATRFASALPLGLTAGWLLQQTIRAGSDHDRLDALSFRNV